MKTFEVQYIKEYPNGMKMVGDKTRCAGPTDKDAAYNYAQQFSHLFTDVSGREVFLAKHGKDSGWAIKEVQ